jgi:hydrogenase maturation protease
VRVLVAGVGNIFLGDDGFGVEVARRLAAEPPPYGVRIADYGIRAVHLAYELMEGYDALILVDTVRRDRSPGTVYVIDPQSDGSPVTSAPPPMDPHALTPETVLTVFRALGGRLRHMVVVGCEPADITESMGLSAPVAAAVDGAAWLVREMVDELAAEKPGELTAERANDGTALLRSPDAPEGM